MGVFGAVRLFRAVVVMGGLGVLTFGAIVAAPRSAGAHAGNSDPNVVHACVNNFNGLVRIVAVNGTCFAGPVSSRHAERAMHWAIVGPKGDKGDQGLQGATGPTGPQGPAGGGGEPPPGPQIYKAFLRLTGVTGGSTDAQHANEIDIQDLSVSTSNPVDIRLNPGSSVPTASRFAVVKMVDPATAALFTRAAAGTHIASAVMQVCRIGANPVCFLEYTLEDVVVSTIVPGVVERLGLSYKRITQKFTTFKTTGAIDQIVTATVDLDEIGVPIGTTTLPPTTGSSRYDAGDGIEIFALFAGIPGSSVDAQHVDWMDVTSVIGGTVITPASAGGARPDFSPITLIKAIDRASPTLLRRALLDQRSATLMIDVCSRAGGTLACNVKYRLENVALTAIASDVALDGGSEAISALYGKITLQLTDGGTVRAFCWDVRAGSTC